MEPGQPHIVHHDGSGLDLIEHQSHDTQRSGVERRVVVGEIRQRDREVLQDQLLSVGKARLLHVSAAVDAHLERTSQRSVVVQLHAGSVAVGVLRLHGQVQWRLVVANLTIVVVTGVVAVLVG